MAKLFRIMGEISQETLLLECKPGEYSSKEWFNKTTDVSKFMVLGMVGKPYNIFRGEIRKSLVNILRDVMMDNKSFIVTHRNGDEEELEGKYSINDGVLNDMWLRRKDTLFTISVDKDVIQLDFGKYYTQACKLNENAYRSTNESCSTVRDRYLLILYSIIRLCVENDPDLGTSAQFCDEVIKAFERKLGVAKESRFHTILQQETDESAPPLSLSEMFNNLGGFIGKAKSSGLIEEISSGIQEGKEDVLSDIISKGSQFIKKEAGIDIPDDFDKNAVEGLNVIKGLVSSAVQKKQEPVKVVKPRR